MKLKTIAGALSFAHLLGLPSNAAAKAADDEEKKDDERAEDDKQREGESDEDYAKRMEEQDDKKAKEEDEGEGDGDETNDKKSKKADDGDDDETASKAERARCSRIIAHGIQHNCVRQAGVFAFDTNLTAKQAIAALDASALDGRTGRSISSRMSNVHIANVGSGSEQQKPDMSDPKAASAAAAAMIIKAGKKRRGEEV
jgi:hypothetical protein